MFQDLKIDSMAAEKQLKRFVERLLSLLFCLPNYAIE
jgi:hypothetical protein